ncbi:MAG: hypothetical protein DCF21_11185, partial [Leptolyngbya sp.]
MLAFLAVASAPSPQGLSGFYHQVTQWLSSLVNSVSSYLAPLSHSIASLPAPTAPQASEVWHLALYGLLVLVMAVGVV